MSSSKDRAQLLGEDSDSDLEELVPSKDSEALRASSSSARRGGGPNGGNGGPPPPPGEAGAAKVKAVQKGVDEVLDIMKSNIAKTLQRGEQLDELEGKTHELSENSERFRRGAKTLRRQMWWNNFKLKLIFGLIAVAILGIIILWIVLAAGG